MKDYRTVPTTPEVWAVIRASHPDMVVFGTRSAPGGDELIGYNNGLMFTSYGFPQGDFPVMEAETTWDINPEKRHERLNVQHRYWLCLPKREDE